MHKDKFLAYLKFEKRYSKNTLVSYETDLTQFYTFLIIEYNISSVLNVNHKIIRYWISFLFDLGISSRSVNRKITTLRSYFKYLIQENIVIENPTRKIIPPKNSKTLPVFIEFSKMNRLLSEIEFPDSFEGERDKLIIDVFYMTGMRLSELLSIQIIDINFTKSTIKVLGKRNKQRIIPLSVSLLNNLKKFSKKYDIDKFLFTNFEGNNLKAKQVYIVVNKYLGMVSSIEKRSPHILRHTFATHMLNNGADINAIKEILGHSNLSATQIYTHNTIDKLKNIHKQAHPRA